MLLLDLVTFQKYGGCTIHEFFGEPCFFFFSFLVEMERLDLDKWPMYYVS